MSSEHHCTGAFRPDDAGSSAPPDGVPVPTRAATDWLSLAPDAPRGSGHSGRRPTARVGIDWITALDRHR